LSKYKKWLDGICLTGGEPCLYGDIDEFLNEIRHLGFRVKLDTNGGFPEVVKKLIQKKLVDFVAMDIKAPIEDSLKLIAHSSKLKDGAAYEKATGVKVDIEKIKKSIKIIMGSGIDYEFRTTVVPALHSAGDILAIAEHIKGAKKYSLQNFSNKEPMDPDFKKIIPYGKEKLEEIRKLVLPLVKECAVKS
jgi:pyruvate formate lyase activating enzyme